jgi:general secretion pathway protein A
MYESFYGLKEKPFNLLPDPEYLYMSQGHENAFTHLEYAISENKGFVVITGEIGSGKTTLTRYLLNQLPQDIQVGLINNTYMPPGQFLKMICQEFELDTGGMDEAEMVSRFHAFLLEQYAANKRVTLIIDEAQNLTPKTLEEIRMLSNLEAEKHHLIQIVLVGQPELIRKLQSKELEQFTQRVTVHCHLNGLSRMEIDRYIRFRLEVAGTMRSDIFDPGAIEAVAKHSRGIPRLINILCDMALVYGYAEEISVINEEIIEEVFQARASGGIFPGYSPEERPDQPIPSKTGASVSEHLDSKVQAIERRIGLVEQLVRQIEKRLDILALSKDKRDGLVLDLFRMLKNSMDSRQKVLIGINQSERKKGESQAEKESGRNAGKLSPLFGIEKEKMNEK